MILYSNSTLMLSNEINILSVATCITIGHLSYQREQISSLLIHANYKLVSTLQNMWKLFNFESSPRHFKNQHNKTTLTWFIARLNVMKPMIINTKKCTRLNFIFLNHGDCVNWNHFSFAALLAKCKWRCRKFYSLLFFVMFVDEEE